MNGNAKSIAGVEAGPGKCERCGASTQLGDGICVSCLLKEGLEAKGEASADVFGSILAEADVPDKEWRLGNYQIVREIGRGGMGAVYLAKRADEQYEKHVAIKLIKRGMDTDSVLRHFRNERQILAGFDHPNIARLFDGGTTENGLPYFVMEYVEGLPIDQYCDKHGLSVNDRLRLFREICAAVSYAHRHLVIHRDIKRSNILVTAEGVPKLLDFGIAKILQQGDGAESLATVTGLRLMTPEYASPEQLRGEPVTTASDVYSLGVVLYELLTHRSPYGSTSRTPYDIARAVGETAPKKPSTVIAESDSPQSGQSRTGIFRNPKLLKGDLDTIVLMALRKEPQRRYQSAEQFSEDIRRHLEALPVRARKDTLAYRGAKFVRRNKAATIAAAFVFLTLVGGIIATTWQTQIAKAEKARAERRFNDVRKLANTVLFDYHDAIKDLHGATPVRERLVKDALVYLDSLAREAGDDPTLQRELAAAYDRVGDVRGQVYQVSFGDMAGAMESYEKAARIREALVAGNSKDMQNRRDLAGSYRQIGNQLQDTSEARRGLEYLRRALTVYRALAEEQPENSEMRRSLADIYNDLGSALENWSDTSGALENHRQALALREQFVAADPRNPKARRDLAVTHINIGRALYLSGDAKGALESNQKALVLCAALSAENPTNAQYRRIFAVTHQNDGDYRAFLGDISGGLESFRKKLVFDEQALAADPANAQSRGDLAYSSQRIADLLAKSGDYSQALSSYRKAQGMLEKVSADAPQDLIARYRVLVIRACVGKMQAKLGERAAGLTDCRKAIDLLNETPDDPTNAIQASFRAQIYTHVAEAYVALAASSKTSREDWRVARDMYKRSLDIWLDQRKRGLLSGEDAAKPEEVVGQIAESDAALSKKQ